MLVKCSEILASFRSLSFIEITIRDGYLVEQTRSKYLITRIFDLSFCLLIYDTDTADLQVAEGYSTWTTKIQRWIEEADGLGYEVYSHGANYRGCY